MRIIITVFLLSLLAIAAAAQTTYFTKADKVACIHKSDLEKAQAYAAAKDKIAFDKLFDGKRCLITKAGVEVQIMDTSWTKVKIRPLGLEGTLWTEMEYLTPK